MLKRIWFFSYRLLILVIITNIQTKICNDFLNPKLLIATLIFLPLYLFKICIFNSFCALKHLEGLELMSFLLKCRIISAVTNKKNLSSPMKHVTLFPSHWPAARVRFAGSGDLPSSSGLGSSAAVCPPNSSPARPPAASSLPSFLTVAVKTKSENIKPLMPLCAN